MAKSKGQIQCWKTIGKKGARWYYRIVAGNGEPVGTSQGYMSRSGRNKAVQREWYKDKNLVIHRGTMKKGVFVKGTGQ